MKFHDCGTAPSPRRVRIFLREKGLEIETVEVDLGGGEHLGAAFRALNPDCTVPVLELDDGTCLTEVLSICDYIESLHPTPALIGEDAKQRAVTLGWLAKVEQQGLSAVAETFRNRAKGFRGRALTGPVGYEQIPALVERGAQRIEQFFDRANAELESRQYIAGDFFSIADIALVTMADFAKWSKIGLGEDRTALQRWYDEVSQRSSMKD